MRTKHWALPELLSCPFFTPREQAPLCAGNWQQKFAKPQPLHLDLGCGKAVFLARAALSNPNINYLGIDINHSILGVARRNLVTLFGKDPQNVQLTFYNIECLPEILLPTDGVERIYVNFCNPWPKAKHHKRRLTYPRQLLLYKQLLGATGEFWFKTDNDELFADTLEYLQTAGFLVLQQTQDLHAGGLAGAYPASEHEEMFAAQGIAIKALRAIPDPAFSAGKGDACE